MTGLVVRVDGIACTVQLTDGQRRRARLAGQVMRQREGTAPVAVGDRVRLQPLDGQFDLVEQRLPRRNELVRAAAGGGRLKQVIAANLDLLVIVLAIARPEPVLARLDRFLIIAAQAGIPPLIVINKLDLASEPASDERLLAIYRQLGYPLLATSVRTKQGIAELRDWLTGRLSALVGASGVGKSSLLNAVQPGLRLRAGEVSRSGKGRHTTTAADLLPLTGGGFVADTPGLKELGLWAIRADELIDYFPELAPLRGSCRFATCRHRQEPGCSLLRALAEGRLDPGRYQSYQRLYDELTPARAW
jgi:ribosome biogenesis GTPase